MYKETFTYRVAGHKFSVSADGGCEFWQRLKPHYDVFADDSETDVAPSFAFEIEQGRVAASTLENMTKVYSEKAKEPGFFGFHVFSDNNGGTLFEIQYPSEPQPNGWVIANSGFDKFRIIINSDTCKGRNKWLQDNTFTTSAMLSFMLATTSANTLTMHASCVVNGGKAYLFLGKSGTGKSTHSRLWLNNIADTYLLNDDHPIVRISDDGTAIAYGSPWSGKTDCYKNLSAEIGAIVRIMQAPHNKITKQTTLHAYSSLMTSASGLTWFEGMADSRHKTLEQVVSRVPMYELECLPDEDAALLCFKNVTNHTTQ